MDKAEIQRIVDLLVDACAGLYECDGDTSAETDWDFFPFPQIRVYPEPDRISRISLGCGEVRAYTE